MPLKYRFSARNRKELVVHGALSVSALKVMAPCPVRRVALYGRAAFTGSKSGIPLKLSAGTAGV